MCGNLTATSLLDEQNEYDKQFIFVAATIPTTGRKSVLAWFQRKNRDLFGRTLYVSTDGTMRFQNYFTSVSRQTTTAKVTPHHLS